jgi:hypothetical protein
MARGLLAAAVWGAMLFVGTPVRADENPTEAKAHTFRFKDANWDEVLDWYAKASGLTPICTVKPTGKFTFDPPAGREYALDEIHDLIDDGLEPHGLFLYRGQVTFGIHGADEPGAGPRRPFEVAALPRLSKRYFTGVEIRLTHIKAADVADDVQKLLGPSGSVLVLEKYNRLIVSDRVSNLRVAAEWVRRAELRATETVLVPSRPARACQVVDLVPGKG